MVAMFCANPTHRLLDFGHERAEKSLGMAKKKKVRVDMRKNRSKPPRERQWTRGFQEHGFAEEATASGERGRAKGDLSRRMEPISMSNLLE
jgi:hypothetical protein